MPGGEQDLVHVTGELTGVSCFNLEMNATV